MASQKFTPRVIVVGAGPSGLLLTLLLARLSSIPVLLLDAAQSLDTNPRATHYGPPAIPDLRRAGVIDSMYEKGGFLPGKVCWRKLDGTYLAGIGFTTSNGPPEGGGTDRTICLPLSKLGRVFCDHLEEYEKNGLVKIRWGAKVNTVTQSTDRASVVLEGGEQLDAEYVVGCDGANSIVRRILFEKNGDREAGFPGMTWDVQVVATNTYYDFSKFGWEDANFIIDPVHWYMAARISDDGMWRVSYGELAGFGIEELKKRQPAKFRDMLPGHPEPEEYRIVNFSPYKVHQRLAPRMREGRVLLAADAAHLCNPFGGMGLTGGIVDIGGLYDCLAGALTGKADADAILEKYHEIRSQKWREIINPVSSSNILRLFKQNPDTALEEDDFLKMCLQMEKGFYKQDIMGLTHDFTQYYGQEAKEVNGSHTGEKFDKMPAKAAAVAVTD